MRVFSNLLISAAAIALTFSPVALADIGVGQDDGIWTVTAAGEPLSEVLSAIQTEAGFRLVGADRLIDDNPVTADISGPLGDVLARLLAGFDYALVYGETPGTSGELQRVILLSGRAGDAPDESQRLTVERLPGAVSEEDGERVSNLLARQVQPLIEAETAENGSQPGETMALAAAPAAAGDSTTSSNDDYELDPETQAALADATRRAQQDLQALVNALQAAEDSGN
ncbi:MAG: hypothetical protein COW29_05220 [Rhodobacterales bacterium CG15_BIG_FIL_POST_REV_8_21_14_020_59_13]|nr:MAG: hypothetical protein COW29_05220 [Rhodobacterales bacterium CG15_BIG_FIL_POST_REV_8_21_14_020_59_13]